jgi:hypothetical protein
MNVNNIRKKGRSGGDLGGDLAGASAFSGLVSGSGFMSSLEPPPLSLS